VAIAVDDLDGLCAFVKDNVVDFVVIGPEAPMVLGLADRLRALDVPVFSPSAAAAQLEGSKGFMKDLCAKYNVPTAAYGRFTDVEKAKDFIRKNGAPIVVKADGLAAGKGVVIAETVEEAETAVTEMLSGAAFGAAGREVVIEEFLDGEEVSFFALSDGKTVLSFGSAQDHKRVGDGDTGLNTGGMGTVSPAPLMSPALEKKVMERIVHPLIDGMAKEGCAFTGTLFAGLMIVNGEPIALEFNVRFGDPECQVLMARLKCDLGEILFAGAQGKLADVQDKIKWSDDVAVCVVMAAKGYPAAHVKNTIIRGVEAVDEMPHIKVFHAGTARDAQGNLINVGGRVLGVTATGADFSEAQRRAYQAVDAIDWADGFCRRDIGHRAVGQGLSSFKKAGTK
jgi:phosphoribosylamine--glycine ligase